MRRAQWLRTVTSRALHDVPCRRISVVTAVARAVAGADPLQSKCQVSSNEAANRNSPCGPAPQRIIR